MDFSSNALPLTVRFKSQTILTYISIAITISTLGLNIVPVNHVLQPVHASTSGAAAAAAGDAAAAAATAAGASGASWQPLQDQQQWRQQLQLVEALLR